MNWLEMGMGLFGGLAMFLFGMEQMGDGLKAAAGERMKEILAKLTKNRISAAVTGALVTAVIQSSSVTTVLAVGFVSAGLMQFTQCIGIIMGANVGTTMTAQIVAFNVEEAALALIAIGFFMLFLGKKDKVKQIGGIVMGLGLIFYGMGVMSHAMVPLRSYEPFLDLMVKMENPLIGILVATVFTALVQSSSATTGIVIVMASQGFVSLEAGIALAFGSNIGTCITALLASVGKPREALRVSAVHVLFNVLGVLLWLPFIDQLAGMTVAFSPASPELTGVERLAAEAPRQIANANTLFNLVNTVVFLGLAGVIAGMVRWLVPDQPEDDKVIVRPRFLDTELLETPSLALDRVRLEIGHVGEVVVDMLGRLRPALLSRDREMLQEIVKLDDKVDVLDRSILEYLGRLRQQELTEVQSTHFQNAMNVTNYLESIGDTVKADMVALVHKALDKNLDPSETERHLLSTLYETTCDALEKSIRSIREEDQLAAQDVISMKAKYAHQVDEVFEHQAGRLGSEVPKLIDTVRFEMELVDALRRIYTLAKRVAKAGLPMELAGAAD